MSCPRGRGVFGKKKGFGPPRWRLFLQERRMFTLIFLNICIYIYMYIYTYIKYYGGSFTDVMFFVCF